MDKAHMLPQVMDITTIDDYDIQQVCKKILVKHIRHVKDRVVHVLISPQNGANSFSM